ncbi:YlbD family protein [Microbacteriaceae bacterium 4G12]
MQIIFALHSSGLYTEISKRIYIVVAVSIILFDEVNTMTTAKELHPSVQQFKEFVRNHPKLIQEVRSGNKTWQQWYEEWYLLGENDGIWKAYEADGVQTTVAASQESTPEAKKDFMGQIGQIVSFMKNINMDQVQHHLANVTNTIGSVQQVIQQFQGNDKSQTEQAPQNNPFFFQKD